ncbi:hypothetical protein quinque_015332 [Culex quinquefasciatus]
MFLKVLLLATAVSAYTSSTIGRNKLKVTSGCRQYNSDTSYTFDIPYFLTSDFRNVQTSNGTTKLRMGVSGHQSAYIRLSPTLRPFKDTRMHEIVISYSAEHKTYLQRYVRSSPEKLSASKQFEIIFTKGWISIFEPLMFTVEVSRSGRVMVTRDSERDPFIDATDVGVSAEYIGFSNWNANDKAVFFVDCPLEAKTRALVSPRAVAELDDSSYDSDFE